MIFKSGLGSLGCAGCGGKCGGEKTSIGQLFSGLGDVATQYSNCMGTTGGRTDLCAFVLDPNYTNTVYYKNIELSNAETQQTNDFQSGASATQLAADYTASQAAYAVVQTLYSGGPPVATAYVASVAPVSVAPVTHACPDGYEWDGLNGLSGCKPNSATLAAQAAQVAAQATATALALQKQKAASECPVGYEWDGILDNITTGLSGCRLKTNSSVPAVIDESNKLTFLTTTIAGVPVWAGLSALVALALVSGR